MQSLSSPHPGILIILTILISIAVAVVLLCRRRRFPVHPLNRSVNIVHHDDVEAIGGDSLSESFYDSHSSVSAWQDESDASTPLGTWDHDQPRPSPSRKKHSKSPQPSHHPVRVRLSSITDSLDIKDLFRRCPSYSSALHNLTTSSSNTNSRAPSPPPPPISSPTAPTSPSRFLEDLPLPPPQARTSPKATTIGLGRAIGSCASSPPSPLPKLGLPPPAITIEGGEGGRMKDLRADWWRS